MLPMTTLDYTVRFLTPAFLGDAEQHGRWRTPPFKALLRQWWRVAYAADQGFNVSVNDMRREEGLLFGHAWLENDTYERNGRQETTASRRSLVRLRLDRWDEGRLKKQQWPTDSTVVHPEVRQPVGSALYLGYGPLEYAGKTALKKNAAIQAGESVTFSLAIPHEHAKTLLRALWLMDRYGTVGGRSRNGWGSFTLTPTDGTQEPARDIPLRKWEACLDRDWPHAIGKDEKGPLIWQTQPHDDWKALMKTLAIIKIGVRTQFVFGAGSPTPEPRHWLSYPVTNHPVKSWGNTARLPNSLRFKVRQIETGKLIGIISHMPHLPPSAFQPNKGAIEEVWKNVHALLEELCQSSGRTYGSITDPARQGKLKPELDKVLLKRIPE
jgi:CRISPR-associated protein Cmr1